VAGYELVRRDTDETERGYIMVITTKYRDYWISLSVIIHCFAAFVYIMSYWFGCVPLIVGFVLHCLGTCCLININYHWAGLESVAIKKNSDIDEINNELFLANKRIGDNQLGYKAFKTVIRNQAKNIKVELDALMEILDED